MLEDLFASIAVLSVLVMVTMSAAALHNSSIALVRRTSEEISESYRNQLERSTECMICSAEEEDGEDLYLPN